MMSGNEVYGNEITSGPAHPVQWSLFFGFYEAPETAPEDAAELDEMELSR